MLTNLTLARSRLVFNVYIEVSQRERGTFSAYNEYSAHYLGLYETQGAIYHLNLNMHTLLPSRIHSSTQHSV